MTPFPEVTFKRGAVRPVECIKGGWNLIQGNYWLVLGMCIVGWMIGSALPLGILMGPMMCGLFLTFFMMRRGEPYEFGTLFKGFEHFGRRHGQGVEALDRLRLADDKGDHQHRPAAFEEEAVDVKSARCFA